jgi:hypothetical protein
MADMVPTAAPRRSRRVLAVALTIAWAGCCLGDVAAASSYVYFEPTDEALATAAAAATHGQWWSAALIVLGAGAAAARRRAVYGVLALPGLLGVAVFVSRPAGHGLPLVVVVASSTLAVATIIVTRGRRVSERLG